MEIEDFSLIHRRYENFIEYLNETKLDEITAYDNWIKRETLVLAKRRGSIEPTTEKPYKIDCVFCYKEVARQNISFHYDSCLGAQFFNYMRGGIFKGRHSCKECGKIFLKKHRNRHSCDINKKNAYITCEFCGFNFIYHKKCRVKDLVEDFLDKYKFRKENRDSEKLFENFMKKNGQKANQEELNKNKNIKYNIEENDEINEDNCEIHSIYSESREIFEEDANLELNNLDANKNMIVPNINDNNIANDQNNSNCRIKSNLKIFIHKDFLENPSYDAKEDGEKKLIDSNKILSHVNKQDLPQVQNKSNTEIVKKEEFQDIVMQEEKKEKPISLLTKMELLKIAKSEMKIMIKFKKWFDKMRTNAMKSNSILSYRKELCHINQIMSKLPNSMRYECDRKENISSPFYFKEEKQIDNDHTNKNQILEKKEFDFQIVDIKHEDCVNLNANLQQTVSDNLEMLKYEGFSQKKRERDSQLNSFPDEFENPIVKCIEDGNVSMNLENVNENT